MSTDVLSVRKRQEGLQFVNGLESDSDSDVEMSNDEKTESTREAQDGTIVTPGELVTDDPVWMRGHGTYFLENQTYASVAGTVSRVNRLLSVIPLRGRYAPETGDHVIGRIAEVGNRRWKVDIGAKQHAVLMLGSVNLPGGVLRRKSESDELQMRSFLKEGDLLNAEVQSLFQDGSASLHTRSLKYGKLRNGVFLQVPSPLVVRSKNHTHNLPGNVTIILGVNGFIWLRKTSEVDTANNTSTVMGKNAAALSGSKGDYKPGTNSVSITRLEEESSWEIYSDKNDHISDSMKKTITRYSNVIKALAHCEIGITEARVVAAYEASMAYSHAGSLIDKDNMEAIGQDVINAEKMRGNA
ncbi:LANO_0G16820g1_1 [Lachancea nothofagi CBS 11611]|uniref:LANO_0G16820g1_1 n=1 Tax=Lachancea nothofagi CBS 11611 TaxID=1266666 RepID=A0A1G4KKS9_9SACH|nr:LANO_0G16820g1_1 [Lachancea nothofagi CBS 11611]